MRLRIFTLVVLCGAMVWGGYQASVLRANALPQGGEALAQVGGAGAGAGFFAGTEGAGSTDGYRMSQLSVFSNVALHVKDNYVDPARIDPKEMLLGALNEIERQIAEVLVEDLGDGKVRVTVPGHQKVVTVRDVESLWEINLKLRDVFRFFEKNLPPQKDIRAVEYAAVNGALSTLDPHSVLLKPEAFAEMKTSTKGEFGGLGIVISIRDAKLTIISPLDGTPAARAGLKAFDVITRIGDVSTVSMPIEEAVKMLRGPEGSKVTIWVERKGWTEARKFTLTRQRIKIESVESQLLEDGIGYIKIKNFQQNTGRDLDDHIVKLEKKAKNPGPASAAGAPTANGTSGSTGEDANAGAKTRAEPDEQVAAAGSKSKSVLRGLIIDLRNNPGGLLEQAIKVSDKFLSSGDIVTTVGYGNKLREPKAAQWSTSDLDTPLVVLVNNGSASASEIVAGALKNLDRAVVIGQRTFGKGSVQVLYDFPDNSALKLTIAQYLTPGNISIQNIGVAPDIMLREAKVEAPDKIRLFSQQPTHREDNLDKHLDRASDENAPELKDEKPEAEIAYLAEKKEGDAAAQTADEEETAEAEPEAEEEAPSAPTFVEDYPITFARKLLAAAGQAKRTATLTRARKLVEKSKEEEESKIRSAIEKLGYDWSPVPTPVDPDSRPNGTVTASLRLEGGVDDRTIAAGTEVSIVAEVTNAGVDPLYRVRGHLDTKHPAFGTREMVFGTLLPGQTQTSFVKAKISKEAASRSDVLTLRLDADSAKVAEAPELALMTQYIPHPQFAYSFSMDDEKRGDGDGVLERGEGVDFLVHVTNVGEGDADAVSLRLKSGAGEDLFLEQGRAEIGQIKAGETKTGHLGFRVRKNQTPGKDGLPLELTIYDPATNEWLEDELMVVVKEPQGDKLAKRPATVGVLGNDVLVLAGADPHADVIGTLKRGDRVSYDGRLGSFLRVQLTEDAYAWVFADAVKKAPPKKKGKLAATLAYHPARQPPQIAIEGKLGGRVVSTESISLEGTVTGRSLRDMYVVLNDEKVFYSPGPKPPEPQPGYDGTDASTWRAPDDHAVTLPFQHELKLNDGLNRVLIVARLDERVITLRNLFISRVKPPASPTVAEAAPGVKPAQPVGN